MNIDPRLLFLVRALHCVVESGDDLESAEVDGLKRILETVIIDGRDLTKIGVQR
jgi:hypothetical protein